MGDGYMESYRIGEFAKLQGISVQLLKYYDQQGILPPHWKDESGRYYVDTQSIELMEQRYLNRAGMPLRDARKLQEDGTLEDWLVHLSGAVTVVEKEIQERQALLGFINEIRGYMEQIQRKEPWRIEQWEGGKFFAKEFAVSCAWGKDGELPIEIWQRITLPEPPSVNGAQCHWGCLYPVDFPVDATRWDIVPGGPCFVYAHSIPKYADYDSERLLDQAIDFAEPLRIMKEHGLVPRGVLFQRWLATTHEKEGTQVQVITRIPLQQDGE